MLLFKPGHVALILGGQKTQTRWIWKKKRCNIGSIHLAKTKMLDKEYFAELLITKVWQERLGDISKEDARKEGGYMRNSTTDNLFEEEVLSHGVNLKKAPKVSVVLILLYILGLIWSYKTSVEIFYLYLVLSFWVLLTMLCEIWLLSKREFKKVRVPFSLVLPTTISILSVMLFTRIARFLRKGVN